MNKKIIALFLSILSIPCFAIDVYDFSTNQLTIQSVDVSGTTYKNVVITVGGVIGIIGGSPNGSSDSYNPMANQLSIPSVLVNGSTYTNVVISVGQIVSVGATSTGGSSASGGAVAVDGATDSANTNSSSVLITTLIAIN
jgi:hypothetical protein